jgi:hypothetical protein
MKDGNRQNGVRTVAGQQILTGSGDQALGTGDAGVCPSAFEKKLNDAACSCVHTAILSWRYNSFNINWRL